MPTLSEPRLFAEGAYTGHETVLVAEDETVLRELARIVLKRCGYRVFEAYSGTMALSLWKQHAPEIDLLVTDLLMPEGMTGLELADKLHAQKPALKVLYTSGSSLDELDKDWVRQAATHFLQKPYTPRQLAAAVRHCLDAEV
jgi:two-component system, cell cycle sensor histidine kinase and response regulator CckA